jgi:hypothetical protein
MLNVFQGILDFVDENCSQLVDRLIDYLKTFPSLFQVLFIIFAMFLMIVGTITLIKKSAKAIIIIAAIMIIVIGISILF